MKKAIEIPALKGWGEIRFNVLSNQDKDKFETSQDPFHRYFLDLEVRLMLAYLWWNIHYPLILSSLEWLFTLVSR